MTWTRTPHPVVDVLDVYAYQGGVRRQALTPAVHRARATQVALLVQGYGPESVYPWSAHPGSVQGLSGGVVQEEGRRGSMKPRSFVYASPIMTMQTQNAMRGTSGAIQPSHVLPERATVHLPTYLSVAHRGRFVTMGTDFQTASSFSAKVRLQNRMDTWLQSSVWEDALFQRALQLRAMDKRERRIIQALKRHLGYGPGFRYAAPKTIAPASAPIKGLDPLVMIRTRARSTETPAHGAKTTGLPA